MDSFLNTEVSSLQGVVLYIAGTTDSVLIKDIHVSEAPFHCVTSIVGHLLDGEKFFVQCDLMCPSTG